MEESRVIFYAPGRCRACDDGREYQISREEFDLLRVPLYPTPTTNPVTVPTARPVRSEGQKSISSRKMLDVPKRPPETWGDHVQDSRNYIENLFAQKVPNALPHYRRRDIQLDLAAHIHAALLHNAILLAEAGVGTGKTFAYLTPILELYRSAFLNGPVIISTKTINLIDQLVHEDLPPAMKAIVDQQSLWLNDNRALAIKGQGHYACLLRIKQSKLPKPKQAQYRQWVLSNPFGERPRVEKGRTPPPIDADWEHVRIEECSGKDCHEHQSCPYLRLKDELYRSPAVIITNHNILANDLLQSGRKQPGQKGRSGRGYWTRPGAIVIDEAHAFESAFRQQRSTTVSKAKLVNLIALLVEMEDDGIQPSYCTADDLERAVHELFALVNTNEESQVGGRLQVVTGETLQQRTKNLLEVLSQLHDDADIESARGRPSGNGSRQRLFSKLFRRVRPLREAVDGFYQVLLEKDDDAFTVWAEPTRQDLVLVAAPVKVGPYLDRLLWEHGIPVILLSATLVSDNGFEPVIDSLGLVERRERTRTFQRSTGFRYEERVRIYVPSDLPTPKPDEEEGEGDNSFTDAIKARIEELLRLTGGRSLVLFTSHRRMHEVAGYLKTRDLDFELLVQGDSQAMERFKREETSVLLATGAYWEGIDAAGQTLSQVILDKLPFPHPGDPLIAAQSKQAGKASWEKVFVPYMTKMLRQGAGRLIRREEDWGIISLLDRRARTKYAGLVKNSLPPAPWTGNLEELRTWFIGRWREWTEPATVIKPVLVPRVPPKR